MTDLLDHALVTDLTEELVRLAHEQGVLLGSDHLRRLAEGSMTLDQFNELALGAKR